jgi:hypothetical protein
MVLVETPKWNAKLDIVSRLALSKIRIISARRSSTLHFFPTAHTPFLSGLI